MKRYAAVLAALGALVLGAGSAHADKYMEMTVYGHQQCSQMAAKYRSAGYWAECRAGYGDRYTLRYRPLSPGEEQPTISGSLGDAVGGLFK